MTDFVQALQGYMQEKNIGQRGLARLLGRAHSTISQWLSGHKICKTQAEVLHKLGLGPPPLPAKPPTRKRRKQLQGMSKAIRIIRKATKRPVIIQLRPIKAEPAS